MGPIYTQQSLPTEPHSLQELLITHNYTAELWTALVGGLAQYNTQVREDKHKQETSEPIHCTFAHI